MFLLTVLASLVLVQANPLDLVVVTWNTEYYYPKKGDMDAILKANRLTKAAVCNADAVVLLFQEVEYEYLNSDVCKSVPNTPATPKKKAEIMQATHTLSFMAFRNDFRDFLSRCPANAKYATSGKEEGKWLEDCTTLYGKAGTKFNAKKLLRNPLTMKKNMKKALALNAQTLYVFHRSRYTTLTITSSLSMTEKGGVGVVLAPANPKQSKNRALVVGVHLDCKTDEIRNEQIQQLLTDMLQSAAICEKGHHLDVFGVMCVPDVTGEHCPLGEQLDEEGNCVPASPATLARQLTTMFPNGVYITGDSNYRLPVRAFQGMEKYTPMAPKPTEAELKKAVLDTLVDLAHNGKWTGMVQDQDRLAMAQSLLTQIGFSVNTPYGDLPPSYPYISMQPAALPLDDDAEERRKQLVAWTAQVRHFVQLWRNAQHTKTAESRAELRKALEVILEKSLNEHEALKIKMKKDPHPVLNIGYLDRLFLLAPAGVTIHRQLEMTTVIHGGDHLPQLFSTRAVKTTGTSTTSSEDTTATEGKGPGVVFETSTTRMLGWAAIEKSPKKNEKVGGSPDFSNRHPSPGKDIGLPRGHTRSDAMTLSTEDLAVISKTRSRSGAVIEARNGETETVESESLGDEDPSLVDENPPSMPSPSDDDEEEPLLSEAEPPKSKT